MADEQSELVSTKQAAKMLGVGIDTVLAYIRRGRLTSLRLNDSGKRSSHGGPRHRIKRADVVALLSTYEAKK